MRDYKTLFEIFRDRFSSETREAEPLGAGSFGLAIGRGHCVNKALLRYDAETPVGRYALQCLEREVLFLKIFAGKHPPKQEWPQLKSDIAPLKDPEFFAKYTMSRVEGTARCWPDHPNYSNMPRLPNDTDILCRHFEAAGKALARFHTFTTAHLRRKDLYRWDRRLEDIPEIPTLDRKTNSALEKANDWFQAHQNPSVIHGDFHGGNILCAPNGSVTAIIDPSCWAYSNNHIRDFIKLPEKYLPVFAEGYRQGGGVPYDPMLATMTRISECAAYINRLDRKDSSPAEKEKAVHKLNGHLQNVAPVTGYQPHSA